MWARGLIEADVAGADGTERFARPGEIRELAKRSRLEMHRVPPPGVKEATYRRRCEREITERVAAELPAETPAQRERRGRLARDVVLATQLDGVDVVVCRDRRGVYGLVMAHERLEVLQVSCEEVVDALAAAARNERLSFGAVHVAERGKDEPSYTGVVTGAGDSGWGPVARLHGRTTLDRMAWLCFVCVVIFGLLAGGFVEGTVWENLLVAVVTPLLVLAPELRAERRASASIVWRPARPRWFRRAP